MAYWWVNCFAWRVKEGKEESVRSSVFTFIQVSVHRPLEINSKPHFLTSNQYTSSHSSMYRPINGRKWELYAEKSLQFLWTNLDTTEKGRPYWFLSSYHSMVCLINIKLTAVITFYIHLYFKFSLKWWLVSFVGSNY